MTKNQRWTFKELCLAATAVVFILFLHGALPFLAVPTLGQAIWTTGFSQSLANGSFFDLHVHDFGFPKPAAIAFGLAGAWPASLLIRAGLHPADAYSGMAAAWLCLAFYAAYMIARISGCGRMVSLVSGVTWMSMPIIWVHAGFSMLSLGIGLLSFYFLSIFKLLFIFPDVNNKPIASSILYLVATIISVFMDGYTFVMFAVGASSLLAYSIITKAYLRSYLVTVALPVHLFSFACAYFLYKTYIGTSDFSAEPIDFFRGWGLDLSFLAIPTQGEFWLADLLGLSWHRSDEIYFGDGSVWMTTFSLPIVILGLVAWYRNRKKSETITGVLLISAFAFYMSLGPSLKINSTKPLSLQISAPAQQSALMPAHLAVMPTGSAWISETLPGFNVMRASYRWIALCIFTLWLMTVLYMGQAESNARRLWTVLLLGVMVVNLPDLAARWRNNADARELFAEIDRDLVTSLGHALVKNERVAFLPWNNDFLANYLAPRVGFRTFNIGGDKNLMAAKAHWPAGLLTLGGALESTTSTADIKLLLDGSTDVLVIPYFDMLWSAQIWPCLDKTTASLPVSEVDRFRGIKNFKCPSERKTSLAAYINRLRANDYLDVKEGELFASVRLRLSTNSAEERAALKYKILREIQYPIEISTALKNSDFLLSGGWYGLEPHHVWSSADARLTLAAPEECASRQCSALLTFSVFGASPDRPVELRFTTALPAGPWTRNEVFNTQDTAVVAIPLTPTSQGQEVLISIPDAVSPHRLTGSADGRTLGIGLRRIELRIE